VADSQPRTLRDPIWGESRHWRLYLCIFRALAKYWEQHHRPVVTDSSVPTNAATENSGFFTYNNKNSRLGYFIYRVPKHSVLISKCLHASREHIHRLFTETAAEGRPLVVASFGGGPSSDLFGFLSYLDSTDWGAQFGPKGWPIVLHVFDMGPWAPFWTHIALALPRYYPSVEVHFHTADLADPDAASLVLPETQLLLFSYFIVEMTPFADGFTAFFTALVATVRPNALFIVMDSNKAAALLGRLAATARLKVVLQQYDPLGLLFPCVVPKSRRGYELKWLKASMTPQLEVWQASPDVCISSRAAPVRKSL